MPKKPKDLNARIPEAVFDEVVKGRVKGYSDAELIAEFIEGKKITINKIKEQSLVEKAEEFNIQGGEAEAVALYWEEKADYLATDDDNVRKKSTLLDMIKVLSKEEMEDRSTTIRKLVMLGYQDFMQRKSAQEYIKGDITLSEAARKANLTIWEMEKYLVEQGYKSSYSIDDINREIGILERHRK